VRAYNGGRTDGPTFWKQVSINDGQSNIKEELEQKPAWAEFKTKAGKERKRLPLACIACRRKKMRCSGEKPACRHCTRSRIPCVYKITTRKAAPRTDYMAMLDKRLKRMEERVIRIIPREEMEDTARIPRATIKPPASAQAQNEKERGADEAFGPQLEEWTQSKPNLEEPKSRIFDKNKVNTEGAEYLPPVDIQEHLSEVFFDCLYGQSYHLMHRPSYMRRLRLLSPSFSLEAQLRIFIALAPCLQSSSWLYVLYRHASLLIRTSLLSRRSFEANNGLAQLEILHYPGSMSPTSPYSPCICF